MRVTLFEVVDSFDGEDGSRSRLVAVPPPPSGNQILRVFRIYGNDTGEE